MNKPTVMDWVKSAIAVFAISVVLCLLFAYDNIAMRAYLGG